MIQRSSHASCSFVFSHVFGDTSAGVLKSRLICTCSTMMWSHRSGYRAPYPLRKAIARPELNLQHWLVWYLMSNCLTRISLTSFIHPIARYLRTITSSDHAAARELHSFSHSRSINSAVLCIFLAIRFGRDVCLLLRIKVTRSIVTISDFLVGVGGNPARMESYAVVCTVAWTACLDTILG